MTIELASAVGVRRLSTDPAARFESRLPSVAESPTVRSALRYGLEHWFTPPPGAEPASNSAGHASAADDIAHGRVIESRGEAGNATGPRSRQRRGLRPGTLRAVLDRIDTRLAAALHIQDLATLAALSPRHFTTAFKRSIGMTPHRYILERRVERAGGLLALSQHSIADVAYQVGFSSQAHFTTMFRKLVGLTPGAFRARSRAGRCFAPQDPETGAGN